MRELCKLEWVCVDRVSPPGWKVLQITMLELGEQAGRERLGSWGFFVYRDIGGSPSGSEGVAVDTVDFALRYFPDRRRHRNVA
jgi:hypothetical protein